MKDVLDFYCLRSVGAHQAIKRFEYPAQCESVFNAIAWLIDLPDDGRMFYETRPLVEHFIRAWERETGKAFAHWDKIRVLYQHRPADAGGSPDSLYGIKTSHPIFSFLMTFAREKDRARLAFDYLGPFLLRRIRLCYAQVENATGVYLYHLCLAARKIVAASPDLSGEARFDFDYKLRLSLGRRAKEAVVGEKHLSSKGDWSYIKDLLLRDRTRLGAGGGGGEGEKQKRWLLFESPPAYVYQTQMDAELAADPINGFLPDGKPIDTCIFLSVDATGMDDIHRSGEGDVDYFRERVALLPADWFTDPWIARRNKRGMQEAQLMASRLQPWDHRCVALSTVTRLLMLLNSSSPDPALGVIGLSLLCGMSKQTLAKIKVASIRSDRNRDPDESVTERLVQGDRHFDAATKILWWMNDRGSEERARYMPVSLFVRLPLPDVIARHLSADRTEGESLFDKKDFAAANQLLGGLGKDGIRKVTLARLVSTFEGYFVGGAGMPELIADILQGKKREHLRSQHYYISLDWQGAVNRWHEMVSSLLAYSGGELDTLLRNMAWRNANIAADSPSEYAGSVGTPDADSLREYIQQLLLSFPRNSKELIASDFDAWNAYVSYQYLLLALSTGRRPLRDPFPTLDDFDLKQGRMFISDKYNRVFREARVIPMCKTLLSALRQYSHVQIRKYAMLKLKGLISVVSPRMPFLIDEENGELIPVRPADIERLCPCSWEGLKNAPRHFLLTRLHQVGVPQEAIDFLSGHRHEQREPEMRASPVSWELVGRKLAEIIEKEVIQYLGLEVPFVDE